MQRIFQTLFIFAICLSGVTRSTYAQEDKKSNTMWTANWSHDGQYIAVGGEDQIVRIYNGITFELLKSYPLDNTILRVRWHPTKNVLAVGAMGSASCLISVESNDIYRLDAEANFGGRAIAWNHDGQMVALADYEGIITIWSQFGDRLITIRKENTKSYTAIDWHPYKNEFITTSELVRIYDTKGNLLHKFRHREENVLMLCVKWHISGDFFVIGDYGDYQLDHKAVLQFWNSNLTLRQELKVSEAEYRNISWNLSQKKLATASESLRIFSRKGELLHTGDSPNLLWGVDWNPNGRFVVTSDIAGEIRIWNRKAQIVKELTY